jgi:hypothetical protein
MLPGTRGINIHLRGEKAFVGALRRVCVSAEFAGFCGNAGSNEYGYLDLPPWRAGSVTRRNHCRRFHRILRTVT